MNKTSLKSKKLAKVLFAILFGATILTGCEVNVSENPKEKIITSVTSATINSIDIKEFTDRKEIMKYDRTKLSIIPTNGEYIKEGKSLSFDKNNTMSLTDFKNNGYVVSVNDDITDFDKLTDDILTKFINNDSNFKQGDKISFTDETKTDDGKTDDGKTDDDNQESTTIGGIKVVNNGITLESLKNISALQNLSEEDKEIAKTVKTLNIEFPEKEDKTNYSVNLVDISKLHTIFPDAKISASDNIEYTINGGTDRQDSRPYKILNNEFKELTEFSINDTIQIVKSTDDKTLEGGYSTEIRTIIVGDNTKLNITGKYLDVGRNRFVNNTNHNGIVLSDDIEITTYNGEVVDANHTKITSDIAIEQYKQLGLTTPKFDLTISDENAYNFAKNILENYSYDQLNSEGHKLSIHNYFDGEKALYTGNDLNADVPSLKYDTLDFITPSEVKNLKITGTPSVTDKTSSIGYTNVVFTGDMSSITNAGNLNGVIEFKDNPMKNILIGTEENVLIRVNKIDKPIEKIWAKILDFRGLAKDVNLDTIASNVKLGGADGSVQGYFRNTTQKDILKESLRGKTLDGEGYLNHFGTAYSEDVDSEKAQMKTLQSVAEEADGSIKQQTALLDKKAQFIDPDTNKVIFTILNGRQYNS